jgi:endo-1,4-beta-D-glucanase Y
VLRKNYGLLPGGRRGLPGRGSLPAGRVRGLEGALCYRKRGANRTFRGQAGWVTYDDTVSEGQAYGMLLAVYFDDEPTFVSMFAVPSMALGLSDSTIQQEYEYVKAKKETYGENHHYYGNTLRLFSLLHLSGNWAIKI